MTREEAIEILNNYDTGYNYSGKYTNRFNEALSMAIEALEQESKIGHWIDADGDNAICSCCNRLNHLYGNYCKHCGTKMEIENEYLWKLLP